MSQRLPKNLQSLLGRRIEVTPQAVHGLRSMGESFLLQLHAHDPISRKAMFVIDQYLQYRTPNLLVLSLSLSDHPTAQLDLEVVIVPQVRVFQGGRVVKSHKGSADYEALNSLFGLS